MTTLIIKTTTTSDAPPVIDGVVLAFSADPAARWTWPDPQQYLRHFPRFVQAFGGNALTHGSAYDVDGYAGTALWLPPEIHPEEDVLITLVQRTVSAPMHKDVLAVFEQMGRYHPWYRCGRKPVPLRRHDDACSHRGEPHCASCPRHEALSITF